MKVLPESFDNIIIILSMYSVTRPNILFFIEAYNSFFAFFFQIIKVKTVTARKPSNRLTRFLTNKNITRIVDIGGSFFSYLMQMKI